MSILSLMLKGGILMYVLLLISVAVIGIVIEKYLRIARVKKDNAKLNSALDGLTEISSIRTELEANGSLMTDMLNVLYNSDTEDFELIKEKMESTANMKLHELESGMGWLSTFAAVAPLIGFLGTVIGMVRVFMNIQNQSTAGVDINILAGGIWEALLTTIGGLVVGIMAIIFYNDLVQKLEDIMKEMQDKAISYTMKFRQLRD